MGNSVSINYCNLCNQKYGDCVNLQCGHNVHSDCLFKWWDNQRIMTCIECQKPCYDCIVGLDEDDNPVSLYRHDDPEHLMQKIKVSNKVIYTLIRIKDKRAKDVAISKFIHGGDH
jgi:hypothetical protein